MQKINELSNLILRAKQAYYYSDKPIMSDAQYDAVEDELRLLSSDAPVLSMVGAPVPRDSMLKPAKHAIPMGSQSKCNSEAEFRAWYTKNHVKAVHASLKGDGGSTAAYYENGRFKQGIGRGDGFVGEDITANVERFKGLPLYVGTEYGAFTGAVRFETVLTVADWAIVDPKLKSNPRNTGNGIYRRIDGTQSEMLTALAFDLDEIKDGQAIEWDTETQKMARLAELGFNTIAHQTFDSADAALDYFNQVKEDRSTLSFWIDGVVMKIDDIEQQRELGVSGGRPKGQVAWKFDSEGAETVIESVIVSGGHTGGLYPTAQLRPVRIGGTTVKSASLANYDEIARLGVAVGDTVWVVKANDIIPKVIRVMARADDRVLIPTPTCCPFCGGGVGYKKTLKGDGVILMCQNPECEKKSTGKIGRWVNSLDILGLGDNMLEALVERFDLADAADLYTLHIRQAELAQLETNTDRSLRLGQKRAASLLAEIDLKRNLTLPQFLGSLGLDFLGKRRVEIMMKAAGGELAALADWRAGKLSDPVFAAKAGAPNMGAQIQDAINTMDGLIDRLLAAGVVIAPTAAEPVLAEGAVALKTLCISGSLPSGKKKSAYKASLLAAGYDLLEDVSKGLTYLVLADPLSVSAKSQKAKKLGVEVISEEQMIALMG